MKNKALVVVICALCVSCASYKTEQKDERKADGTTSITTQVKVSTLFSSKSQLANSKTSQTEKSQSANLGSLAQESQEPKVFDTLVQGLIELSKAMVKSQVPIAPAVPVITNAVPK